jgi:hypothetical protein
LGKEYRSLSSSLWINIYCHIYMLRSWFESCNLEQ